MFTYMERTKKLEDFIIISQQVKLFLSKKLAGFQQVFNNDNTHNLNKRNIKLFEFKK